VHKATPRGVRHLQVIEFCTLQLMLGESEMKRVLIISYFYPLSRRGGSARPEPLAKYLPEFGWQPIFITPPLRKKPNFAVRVIETCDHMPKRREEIGIHIEKRFNLPSHKSYNHIRPFLSFVYKFYHSIASYPDSEKGWKPFATEVGDELLQKENVDAMLSCTNPKISSIIARDLKARYKIPWVADFCDLWSQNHNYSYGRLRHFYDQRLELKTLLAADALVTVSEPWAEKLRTLHRRKTVYAITHGFDPEEVNSPPAKLTDKFTITYTGAIYRGKQDPSRLFAALRDLISNGAVNPEDIEVRFYGLDLDWLANEIEGYGLSAVARYYGTVPREIAFEKQRESQLLLLLNWDDYQEKGWHSLKIYAYLGARRPIITVGGSGDDVIKELLDETKAGVYCRTVEDLKNILSKAYLEYKHKGEVSYKGEIEQINKYSCREMARKFADILDSVCQEK